MADGKNLPGPEAPPEAENQAKLKSICISGTELRWALGKMATYTKLDGTSHVSTVVGMVVVQSPAVPGAPSNFTVQVHIRFDDGYTDIIVCEDHLVVKAIEVSVLATPKKTILVPGKK